MTENIAKNATIRDLNRKIEILSQQKTQVTNLVESNPKPRRPNSNDIVSEENNESLINTLNQQSIVMKGYTEAVQSSGQFLLNWIIFKLQ